MELHNSTKQEASEEVTKLFPNMPLAYPCARRPPRPAANLLRRWRVRTRVDFSRLAACSAAVSDGWPNDVGEAAVRAVNVDAVEMMVAVVRPLDLPLMTLSACNAVTCASFRVGAGVDADASV
jgi:hypothetical protein